MINIHKISFRAALLVISAGGLPGPVHAQTAATPEIEEIMVTAQKRSERLQDVPIQVDVLTARDIENQQIRLTSEISKVVPNFAVERTDTYTNSVIVMRGIAQASGSDAPVAVIVDGIPQDDSKQLNMRLFDIEQIEVLKGPQGSIYGRNAEAGAIIIKTAAPTNEFQGFADVSYGNGDTVDATMGISGALVPDKVQFRLAGNYYTSDGVLKNSFTGAGADKVPHDFSLRGNLIFQLSDSTSLRLIGNYSDFNAAGVIFAPVFSGDANDFVHPQSNFPNSGDGTSRNFAARLESDLGFATFSSITGYTKLKQLQITDLDFTPANGVGDNQPYQREIASQEFRLVSPGEMRLRWLIAADYLHSKHDLATQVFLDTGNPATDPYNILDARIEHSSRSNYGVSGQIDYDVQEDLTVTVGARYDRDERKETDFATSSVRQKTFQRFQPRVSVSYRIDPNRQVYATYAVGFRSGSFNGTDFPISKPEVLTNYETGFKTQWLDRKLTLNGDIFYSDIKDFQFSYIDFVARANVTSNIDKVDIKGAELELAATPVEDLKLYANFGLAKTKIKEFSTFPQYVGNHTPRSADWSMALGFNYTHAITSNYQIFLRGDVQHASKRYWFHDNEDVQDPKTFANASVGLESDRWSITVWGKNLFDRKAYDTYFPAQSTGLPYDVAFPNKPRTYGIQVSARY